MARTRDRLSSRDEERSPKYAGSGPRGTLTKAEAAELLAEHKASGLSLAAFARKRGIGVERLRWWQRTPGRRVARRGRVSNAVRLLPVRVRKTVEAAPPPTGTQDIFELALGDGRAVRMTSAFDAAGLRRLLSVLREVT